MKKPEIIFVCLLLIVVATIALSLYVVRLPQAAPDDAVGKAMILLLVMAVGFAAWAGSLVMTIVLYRDRHIHGRLLMTVSILALPMTLAAYAIVMKEFQ